jgi:ribose transport system permease protein
MNKTVIINKLKKMQSFVALVLLCIFFSLQSNSFLTIDNGINILQQVTLNTCIAVGMTLVIITGGIDLSVGSVLALSGAVAAYLIKNGISIQSQNLLIEFTVFGTVLASLLIGSLLGFFNGLMITKFSVPPFVATLAMLTIARGFTMLFTGGYPISRFSTAFNKLGSGVFLGLPNPIWIVLIVVIAAFIFTKKMKWGRYIYAIGSNENVAKLSGINVTKIKLIVYSIAGALAALAGVIITAKSDSAQPNIGAGFELDAIAAVVIGGTSLSGGKGSIWGTVLGAIIIGVLNNGLVLLNVSNFWQQVVKGAVILAAVIVDRINSKSNG